MAPHIRPMQEADLRQVIHLERICYRQPWPAWVLRRAFRKGLSCWVAVHERRVLAYGVMAFRGYETYILNVCVHPGARGHGVGRRLLLHLLGESARRGLQRACLEVRASNRRAIRLYCSLGFFKAGLRKKYYRSSGGREHAFVMACWLPKTASGSFQFPVTDRKVLYRQSRVFRAF